MRKTHPLITGTLTLTAAAVLSRFIGFFYRIFLSHNFGAEGMGIYQLIMPVMALAYSFGASGIQTAISKYVATETTTHDYKASLRILLVGMFISLGLSSLFSILLYQKADFVAQSILLEVRCAPLLRMIAISFPFGCLHACVNGYHYGIRKVSIPAVIQLIEQCIRVGSVFLIYQSLISKNIEPTITYAVIGVVIAELFASIFSICSIYLRFSKLLHISISNVSSVTHIHEFTKTRLPFIAKKILAIALPLSANHMILNLLQGMEATLIPNRLQASGLSNSAALSIYGVLTGMAIPLIMFPSALTNSASVLLLPIVSEKEATNQHNAIYNTIRHSIIFCFLLGFFCTAGFLIFGKLAGEILFDNSLAGSFIRVLSFICPFLYLSTTLTSILHGLGKTLTSFFIQVFGFGIRLLFVWIAIPIFGISGYLWGLLASQLLNSLLLFFALRKYTLFDHSNETV